MVYIKKDIIQESEILIAKVKEIINSIRVFFENEKFINKIKELSLEINKPNIWDNPKLAGELSKEYNKLKEEQSTFNNLLYNFDNVLEIYRLSKSEDQSLINNCYYELISIYKQLKNIEIVILLNSPKDIENCFLEIHAGAGGTESHDWAEMLLNMYIKWANKHEFTVEEIDVSKGEEVGIKSCVFRISGKYAYGFLKTEVGIHRLVRISPFDSNKKRHTSFAAVSVYPDIENETSIDILDKDIKIDTYKAGGAGGQHVNKTDSAVRITHIPSGIIVQSQTDRSQHRNKAIALKLLQAKLFDLEEQKLSQTKKDNYNNQTEIGWGYKIRSYVLHPYQLIKDLRTGLEKNNPKDVFSGEIDDFIKSVLILKANNI